MSFMGCLQAEHSKLTHSYPIKIPLVLEIPILLETIFSGVKLGQSLVKKQISAKSDRYV